MHSNQCLNSGVGMLNSLYNEQTQQTLVIIPDTNMNEQRSAVTQSLNQVLTWAPEMMD